MAAFSNNLQLGTAKLTLPNGLEIILESATVVISEDMWHYHSGFSNQQDREVVISRQITITGQTGKVNLNNESHELSLKNKDLIQGRLPRKANIGE